MIYDRNRWAIRPILIYDFDHFDVNVTSRKIINHKSQYMCERSYGLGAHFSKFNSIKDNSSKFEYWKWLKSNSCSNKSAANFSRRKSSKWLSFVVAVVFVIAFCYWFNSIYYFRTAPAYTGLWTLPCINSITSDSEIFYRAKFCLRSRR